MFRHHDAGVLMMNWLVAGLALVLAVTAFQTCLFYMAWYYDRRNFPEQACVDGDGQQVRPLAGLLAAVLEWLAITFLVLTYPFRLLHDASPVRTRQQGKTPIIFVHGYGGNSANMAMMQLMLKRRGHANVYAVSYTPPTINARKLAQQVADHVNRILAATGADQATLICHSMGGPLSRYALLNLGLAGKVDRVITLGSPHRGSRIAALFAPRGAAAQLRYDSPFIRELEQADPTPGGARFYSIYSNFDNFVLPSSSACLGGNCTNIHVPYHGHCALLYSPRVLAEVERCLGEPLADDAGEQAA